MSFINVDCRQVLFLVACLASVCSCQRSSSTSPATLVGAWEYQRTEDGVTDQEAYFFGPGNHYRETIELRDPAKGRGWKSEYKGTYSVEGDEVVLRYDDHIVNTLNADGSVKQTKEYHNGTPLRWHFKVIGDELTVWNDLSSLSKSTYIRQK